MDYRDTVKKLFTENNVSITEFCNKHGFGSGHISTVLRKEKNRHLTIEQLIAVSTEFGMSTDAILFNKRNPLKELEEINRRLNQLNFKYKHAEQGSKLLYDLYCKMHEFFNRSLK